MSCSVPFAGPAVPAQCPKHMSTCQTGCQATSKASGQTTRLGVFQVHHFHDREKLQAARPPSQRFPETWELESGAHVEKGPRATEIRRSLSPWRKTASPGPEFVGVF